MTVQELIELLSAYPGEAGVYFEGEQYDGPVGSVRFGDALLNADKELAVNGVILSYG